MRKGARFQSGAPVQPPRKRTLGVSSRQSGSSAVPAAIKIKERRTDQADINARRGAITLPYRAYNVRTLICIRVAFLPASSASKQWTEPDGHAITSQKEHPLCRARYKLHFFFVEIGKLGVAWSFPMQTRFLHRWYLLFLSLIVMKKLGLWLLFNVIRYYSWTLYISEYILREFATETGIELILHIVRSGFSRWIYPEFLCNRIISRKKKILFIWEMIRIKMDQVYFHL